MDFGEDRINESVVLLSGPNSRRLRPSASWILSEGDLRSKAVIYKEEF